MEPDCLLCLLSYTCPEHAVASTGPQRIMPEILSAKKGHILFHQDAPNATIYYVMKGTVKLFSLSESGKKVIHFFASSHDLVGLHALIENNNSPFSAEVFEDAQILALERKTVLELIRNYPPLARRIISILAKGQTEALQRNDLLINSGVRERLARCLLELGKNFGEADHTSIRIRLRLSRGELASVVGVAPETLIRFISEFKRLKFITEDEHQIIIQEPKRLLGLCEHCSDG